MAEKRRRDGSKTCEFKFRMSREDMNKLEEASKKLGVSKSDVLRDGIDLEYNLTKNRTDG